MGGEIFEHMCKCPGMKALHRPVSLVWLASWRRDLRSHWNTVSSDVLIAATMVVPVCSCPLSPRWLWALTAGSHTDMQRAFVAFALSHGDLNFCGQFL